MARGSGTPRGARTGEHIGNIFVQEADTGYGKICPGCGGAFGEVKALAGMDRDLKIEWCPRCDAKRKHKRYRDRRYKQCQPLTMQN